MDHLQIYEPSKDGLTDQGSLDHHLNSEPGDTRQPLEYLVPTVDLPSIERRSGQEIDQMEEIEMKELGPEELITHAQTEIERGRDQLGLELLLRAEKLLQGYHKQPTENPQKLLSVVWSIIARYYKT